MAPSIAALTSPSSSRRPSSYGCPGPRHCDQSTIPATPSMSKEIKTFTEDHSYPERTSVLASGLPSPPQFTELRWLGSCADQVATLSDPFVRAATNSGRYD